MQELRRVGQAGAELQHGADHLVTGRDRHLANHLRRNRRRPVLHTVGHIAPEQVEPLVIAGRRHSRRRHPRDDDRHRRARRLGGQRRDPLEAVATEDGVDHPQVDVAQAGDEIVLAAIVCWSR